MLIRKIKHRLLLTLMRLLAPLMGGSGRLTLFAGSASASQLCQHIARTGASRVMIVTDKPLRELGVADQAVTTLVAAGIDIAWFDGVEPNPTFKQVEAGAQEVARHGSEAIVAVGGGSSMDAAKVIALCATNEGSPTEWVGHNKFKHAPLPVFAIPTTSGTGSEATMGAVISDSVTHDKGIVVGDAMLPVAAALDPDLSLGLPAHITAATGIDALTHAIEAYIGVWERGSRSQDSEMAVKLIFNHLATACRDGSNREARESMALAAFYGGAAINQVNVGNVHAIAHQLGAQYGIPHGLANALVLPHVLDFCVEQARPRLAALGRLIGLSGGEAELASGFIQAVRDLQAEIGIPLVSDLIKAQDYESICDMAIAEGDGYPVPRLLERPAVLAILEAITD
jgi:alcohol dehydrogenase class IV